ncbi:FKBP-type peptidyl-prolyl cis-trans isomerase [Magnetospirillum aberrantis]|uniref:peptidylprolyl isomerase n=1 Tax=Magnetospirillum aberrantis SpK TaxID=908842 RepID=A0A7C9QUV1_9PROT|nr:peptidylprolyl isomerase [Magnetospirillum aberrantis]NFV80721.1 peptidylprolyl isomerase [Magnetospirillum aberrantis SpK]
MRIENGSMVTLKYSVSSEDGELIDPGEEPMVYLHGDLEGLFPKLQSVLAGKALNETVTATLSAEDAFGPYDRSLVRVEHAGRFGFDVEVGTQLEGADDQGQSMVFVVREIDGDRVTLDANHPLAGLALVFTCTVTAIRPAS